MLCVGSQQHWQQHRLVPLQVNWHQQHQGDAERQGNGNDGISISVMGCLMVNITSSGQGVQIGLGISEMLEHVGPSFVNGWTAIPEDKDPAGGWVL